MKKHLNYYIIALLVSILLGGCQTQKLTDRREETKTFAIDFRKYAERDFLFMPDKYYGEYEVLGIIRAELHPAVSYRNGKFPAGEGYRAHVFYSDGQRVTQLTELVDVNQLIDHIYELSTEWGGDAFTHFESSLQVRTTDNDPNTTYGYYEISGVVVKRK